MDEQHATQEDAGTAPQLPAWLTVEEYAKQMRIGRSLAYRLVADGRVPTRRVGKNIRIPRSAVIES